MSQEDSILSLFDQYFSNADKQQISEDVDYVNSLGKDGVTFEQYLENLDSITAFPIAGTGVCDDIAYSDYYNNLIAAVSMDDFDDFQIIESNCYVEFEHSSFYSSENIYSMAA
jgi:hypothetical protein